MQAFPETLTYGQCLKGTLRDPNLLFPVWQDLGFVGEIEATVGLGPSGPEYTITRIPSEPEAWMALAKTRWPIEFMQVIAKQANEILLTKRCRLCGIAPFVEIVPDIDRSGDFKFSPGCMHWSRSEWAPFLLKALGKVRRESAG